MSGVLSAYAGSVSGGYLCAPTSYGPAAQTLLTAATTTMSAFGPPATGPFVAPPSGAVMVTAGFTPGMSIASAQAAIGLADHGTTNMRGNIVALEISSISSLVPVTVEIEVTGLTPGTTYDFDLMGCAAAGDTLTVYAIGVSTNTPGLVAGTRGSPVTLTVQAV